jgi:hypothetical protein
MKSRKIRRLEFISDKMEGRDIKREVMCIRFGHPTKKNEVVWGSPWETAMARLELMEGSHGELTGEGKEGEGEDGEGAQVWGAMGRGRAAGGAPWGGLAGCCCYVCALCCAWKNWTWGRREGGNREEKERKEKKEKNTKFFPNLKIFEEKNKRQFMKLVKIIFVQERNNPNYN